MAPNALTNVRSTLQSLILDNNCLNELPPQTLANFTNLLALHMRYNQFADLGKLQLQHLPNLIMLKLTGKKKLLIGD